MIINHCKKTILSYVYYKQFCDWLNYPIDEKSISTSCSNINGMGKYFYFFLNFVYKKINFIISK